jgi:DnaJ-class molecular chaperone
MIKKNCHVCHGKKIIKGLEELTLYIEKGMQNGQEIVCKLLYHPVRNLKNLVKKEATLPQAT